MTRLFYRLLNNPTIYKISQCVLAPGEQVFLNRYFRSLPTPLKGRVLDVGCGPQMYTLIPQANIFGLDIHEDYVKKYVKKIKACGVVAAAEKIPFQSKSFDEVRCFGLLHHLPEETAIKIVQEMVRCTKEEGLVVVLDNVWPKRAWLRPLAWLLRRLDRGDWVRDEQTLKDLVAKASPVDWTIKRFTYSYLGHEALGFHMIKRSRKSQNLSDFVIPETSGI